MSRQIHQSSLARISHHEFGAVAHSLAVLHRPTQMKNSLALQPTGFVSFERADNHGNRLLENRFDEEWLGNVRYRTDHQTGIQAFVLWFREFVYHLRAIPCPSLVAELIFQQ